MFTAGRTFSVRDESGGGEGLYCGAAVEDEASLGCNWKEETGMGREMTWPKKAMLAIHFDERRGSKVNAAAGQYLARRQRYQGRGLNFCYPATSSGQELRTLSASSCWRGSSFTLSVFRTFARILLLILLCFLEPESWALASTPMPSPPSEPTSRGYHPLSLKQMPTPGRVHIASRKWWTTSAGTRSATPSSGESRSYTRSS